MDSSTGSRDSNKKDATEKIRIKDILRCPIPSNNTLLFKIDGIQNFHKELFDESYEDVWGTDNMDITSIGPSCYLCHQTAEPNLEMLVINGTRYFVICENSIPERKEDANEHEGFLQCVYCFNYFHRFGCILSMSKQSYISNLLSRDWACPTCVPEFNPTKLKSVNVKSDCEWKLIVKMFKRLQNKVCVLPKDNVCCCKNLTEKLLSNFTSEEFKYEFG